MTFIAEIKGVLAGCYSEAISAASCSIKFRDKNQV